MLVKILGSKASLLTLAITLSSAVLFGCEDDGNSRTQLSGIGFELAVLDEEDVETTIFEAGTDVRFGLKLINNSNFVVEWKHDYQCQLLQSEDFLTVYKLNLGNETGESYLAAGRPYEGPINCPAINLPAQQINPGEVLIIKLAWSDNPNNNPLTDGKYRVTSVFGIKVADYERSWSLSKGFEIR